MSRPNVRAVTCTLGVLFLASVLLIPRVTAAQSTVRASVDSNGVEGNNASGKVKVSASRRFVAFQSLASNLVAGDANGVMDVFVHDVVARTTTRASVDPNGVEGNDRSVFPSISADGNRVAFISWATNLVPPDANGFVDVFVRDVSAGTTTRVSLGLNGAEPDGNSQSAAISPDGRFVAFESQASNLVVGDTNGASDVFVHDLTLGTTSRVSTGVRGESDGDSMFPSIAWEGAAVAFESIATNLVEGDTNASRDVFVRR
jgi:Tol biopolymer transport system component